MGVDLNVVERKRTRRRWPALVSALALVLAACTSTSDEPDPPLPQSTAPSPTTTTTTTRAEVPEPETAETTLPVDEYSWQVGDCVDLGRDAAFELPYAPYGTTLLIDCAEPHTHEVYFTATLSGGPDVPYPADLNDQLWDVCFVEFDEFMGFAEYDSTLSLILYLPDTDEWAAGERYHSCVVYQASTDDVYQQLFGSAADNPDTYLWQVDPGSCYDLSDLALLEVSGTVACAEEHVVEMIGEAAPTPGDTGYPGPEATEQLAAEACDALLLEYAVQPLEQLPVMTFPVPFVFSEQEWEAGRRTVRCFAFASTDDLGLLIAVGSLGEGTFEIIGAAVEEEEGIPA